MSKTPPKLFLRVFRWYCDPDMVDDIEGDLLERYERHYLQRKFPNWLLARDILLLFRPGIIRSMEGTQKLNHYGMFKNHIKMALRSFKREKGFTAINIIGLTCGLWCALMTMLWIQDEWQYDRFHSDGDQLYRLLMNFEWHGESMTEEGSAYPTGDALQEQLPEVIDRTRYNFPEQFTLEIKGEIKKVEVAAGDQNFFTFFSFPLIAGNMETCLSEPQQLVISSQLAEQYFPEQSVIGQTIVLKEDQIEVPFTVSGVFNIPRQSSLQFDAIVPLEVILSFQSDYDNWSNPYFATYLQLAPDADMVAFHEKMNAIVKSSGAWYTHLAQPFHDQRLYDSFKNGLPSGGKINTLIMFAMVALCSLLIASFNYINLATAKALRRTKEIGLRKIIGAKKLNLIGQFLTESTMLVVIAAILALVLCWTWLPFFNAILETQIVMHFDDPQLYLFLGCILILTVLLSGIYPAVFLASFRPFDALKNLLPQKRLQPILRKMLVGFQFITSIVLITGAFIISQQLSYFTAKDLGFDREQILYLELDQNTYDKYEIIKTDLLANPAVVAVSSSSHDFVGPTIGYTSDVRWRLFSGEDEVFFGIQEIDAGLVDLLGMEVVSGNHFNPSLSEGSTEFLINETAAMALGFDNPIGEGLSFWGKQGEIVGVVKDFHVATLHEKINPVILMNKPNGSYVFVKAKPNHLNTVVDHVVNVHETLSTLPVHYNFLDRRIASSYNGEIALQKLTRYGALMAIVISLLGLLGLASYTCQRRIKEIGIRKVLGSNTWQLIILLTKEFTIIILLAILIGAPIAYYWVNDWLDGFAYRIVVSWWPFVLAGVLAMGLTWLIVGSQTANIARINPTNSLRNE